MQSIQAGRAPSRCVPVRSSAAAPERGAVDDAERAGPRRHPRSGDWLLPATLQEQLAPVLEMPLRFAPGARCAYSDSRDLMLARVIEQVAGERWEAAVASLALAPAGVGAGACPSRVCR